MDNRQKVYIIISMVIGIFIGGVYVTYTKAGQLANIVIERNEQLQALQKKHAEEVAEIYTTFKEKGMDTLDDLSTEEITAATEEGIVSVIEDAEDTAHNLLKRLRGEKEEDQ